MIWMVIKLVKAERGIGNLLINEKQATTNIIQAIEQSMTPIDDGSCLYICLGLAGYGGVENPQGIKSALSKAFKVPFTIVNDAIIAHAALLKGNDGILTISGTGSVSIGIHEGMRNRLVDGDTFLGMKEVAIGSPCRFL